MASTREQSLLTNFTDSRCGEYIYYNTIYSNNTDNIAPIIVNDRRSSPIIEDGIKYRYTGTVKRFLIDSFLIPLTLVYENMSYVISITVGASVYSSPLIFVPSSNSTQATIKNAIFTVEQFVACLNATLAVVYGLAVAGGGGFTATFVPFFTYNSNQTLSLIADTVNYYPGNPTGAKLFVSNTIYDLLGGSMNYEYVVSNSPRDTILLVKSLGTNVLPVNTLYTTANPPVAINALAYNMPFSDSAIVSLTTINQILIQAIATEVRSQLYGSNLISLTPPNLALQTIEDYVYIPNGRGKILYQPFVERPFNLLSDRPITQFSFNVMYMDQDLQTFQALCVPGSTSSFKFCFTKYYVENNIGVLLTIFRLLENATKKLL